MPSLFAMLFAGADVSFRANCCRRRAELRSFAAVRKRKRKWRDGPHQPKTASRREAGRQITTGHAEPELTLFPFSLLTPTLGIAEVAVLAGRRSTSDGGLSASDQLVHDQRALSRDPGQALWP